MSSPMGSEDVAAGGESVKAVDSPSIDAFGRWRSSDPQTIFDSKQIFDNQPLFWDDQEVSGSGTNSTHSVNKAATTISVDDTTAGKRVRQTFMRFNYQPGKSQLVLMTFKVGTTSADVTKQIGIFDDNNGIYLEKTSTSFKIVTRTKTSGSVVDNEVAQANWNLDTMDSNGPSGIDIDTTKTQILVIDFEWLGVGRVRCGFNVDGKTYYFHEFLNANNLATVYMSTPNLPLRYSIENSGTGAASTMDCICSSVISEGGSEDLGVLRYASTGGTHLDANVENTIYAVAGIRLKSAYIGESVKLINTAVALVTGSAQVEWILKLNPTIAGTFTYSDETDSAVQIATGATANTVTGGTDITGGFVFSGGNQSGNAGGGGGGLDNAILLGSAIDGTVDEIVLCVRPVAGSANVDIEGALTWRELS